MKSTKLTWCKQGSGHDCVIHCLCLQTLELCRTTA